MTEASPAPASEPPQNAVHDALRPRENRAVTTLLLGRVLAPDDSDGLCRIRNLSSGGMMFECRRSFTPGQPVAVELRSGKWLQGTIAWSQDGRNGVAFNEHLSPEALRALDKPEFAANRARAPRFEAHVAAHVVRNGQRLPVVIENISQSGAMIRPVQETAMTGTMTLSVPQLGDRLCEARWLHDGAIGVAFAQVIPFDDLARWLDRRPPATHN